MDPGGRRRARTWSAWTRSGARRTAGWRRRSSTRGRRGRRRRARPSGGCRRAGRYAEGGPHGGQQPDGTVGDQPAGKGGLGVVALHQALDAVAAGRLGGVKQRAASSALVARLLAQHVLARLQCPDRPLGAATPAGARRRRRPRRGQQLLVRPEAASSPRSPANARARSASRLATATNSAWSAVRVASITSRPMLAVDSTPQRTLVMPSASTQPRGRRPSHGGSRAAAPAAAPPSGPAPGPRARC